MSLLLYRDGCLFSNTVFEFILLSGTDTLSFLHVKVWKAFVPRSTFAIVLLFSTVLLERGLCHCSWCLCDGKWLVKRWFMGEIRIVNRGVDTYGDQRLLHKSGLTDPV
jgi:hypothetical protein